MIMVEQLQTSETSSLPDRLKRWLDRLVLLPSWLVHTNSGASQVSTQAQGLGFISFSASLVVTGNNDWRVPFRSSTPKER